MSQLRWWFQQARDRLLLLPALFAFVGALGAVCTALVDQFVLNGKDLPVIFQTSVEGGRAVLATIAGALITAYALVLSLLLVAVQLTASQHSPRSLRNWLGDHVLQRAIGLVLGTVVFCLVVLYQTRSFAQDAAFEPHFSVLVGILLGLVSLVVVLRAVDHLADSMRVGSVARRVMAETVALAERVDVDPPVDRPSVNPSARRAEDEPAIPPPGAHTVEATKAGWVQYINVDGLLDACPDGAEVTVPIAVGAFVLTNTPLLWVEPPPEDPDKFDEGVLECITTGDTRTMDQDIGFGIVRLVDVALRALSPSLNDDNTAKDIIAHLGQVVLTLFEHEERPGTYRRDDRRVAAMEYSHREYAHAAFDEIRLAAVEHPRVVIVLIRTLLTIRHEIERRHLPAPVSIVDELIHEIADDVEASSLSPRDRQRVLEAIPAPLRFQPPPVLAAAAD